MKLKIVAGMMLILLIASILTVEFNVQAADPELPVISVNPVDYTAGMGENFTIDIYVTNVTQLGAWGFDLFFDNSLLNATYVHKTWLTQNCTDWFPFDQETGDFDPVAACNNTFNSTHGRVDASALMPLSTPFTGSGPLVTIDFTATAVGNCTLHLDETVLVGSSGPPDYNTWLITHTTLDGSVTVVPFQHELWVSLEAQDFELGESLLLNATVSNVGLSNETDVELFLLVNGTVANNVTIPELVNGTSYTIDYLLTSNATVSTTYNVTAYAPPVSGENVTANNVATKFVNYIILRELVVSLDAPTLLRFGNSSLLNATVCNSGWVNETDVTLRLLINGAIVNSTVISLLQVGHNYTISYLWTPPLVPETYNVTAYAPPVSGENVTANNVVSKYVAVNMGSANVVFVPSPWNPHGGELPTTDQAFAAFNFSIMAWADVNAANLTSYDTVVLMISTSTVPLNASQQADLINWVDGGGKLIIYDSETGGLFGDAVDYSWLPYPMTTVNPGAMGYIYGNITFVENNTLGCTDPGNVTYYINTTMVPTGGWWDAVGDCNTFITSDPHWFGDIKAQNWYSYPPSWGYNGTLAGWVHTYARYGDGLFIYNGFDIDPLGPNSVPDSTILGDGNLAKIWLMELQQAWGIYYNLPEEKPALYYDVTIEAYCYIEDAYVSVNITMDGTPTGFSTNHTFTDLNGTHTFTVPSNDPNGHPFHQWSTGETNTTITVASGGTYYALYEFYHDLAVINVTPSNAVVGQGCSLSINVTIENQGYYTETFNVTAYYNSTTIIDTPTNITLTSGNSTTTTFTWNTTGVEKGDYTISAKADVVPDETDTADNTKVDGTVTVLSSGHDVAINDVTPSETVVGQGCSLSINLTAKNYGNFTETFNVTAYANTTTIEEQKITLNPAESDILVFTWNTTGFSLGNYTISAEADVVTNETYTLDNTYIDGIVTVRLPIHDIAVVDATPSKTAVGQGCSLSINVTVENQGESVETFNVTTLYNNTAITLPNGKNYTTVTLTSRNSTTITFTWNTTDVPYGNYTITAYAYPVPGETNTTDNTKTDGWVEVKLRGDVNDDGKVNVIDMLNLKIAIDQGKTVQQCPSCDITCDDKVNVIDMLNLKIILS